MVVQGGKREKEENPFLSAAFPVINYTEPAMDRQ